MLGVHKLIHVNKNFLLTGREGRTGEYCRGGLGLAALGPYKNDRGPILPSKDRAS